MSRPLFLGFIIGLALLPSAGQAQTPSTPQTSIGLHQVGPALAHHPVKLRLIISQQGPGEQVIGGLRQDTVPCPLFKVYSKAGGPPLIERYITANCDTGENVTFKPGEQRTYQVTLPMQLTPGEYTAILTLRTQPPLYAQAIVNVGPGPFVTELVLPSGARAAQPLDLQVAYRNVWGSAVTRDLGHCGQGLLIRDDQGQTVYDNQPEGVACSLDFRPTTVGSGGVYWAGWGKLPALKVGSYTAILWGSASATMRFEVKP
jgi:hypothetical protein